MESGAGAAVDGGTREVATDAVAVGIDIVVVGARVAPGVMWLGAAGAGCAEDQRNHRQGRTSGTHTLKATA